MISCSILGVTGIIGQQFARILADHPQFELIAAFASERSKGKTIKEIWQLPGFDCPKSIANLGIDVIDPEKISTDIVFSALPAHLASEVEPKLAMKGIGVFSNASAHRMKPNVPILIPEINPEHARLVRDQKKVFDSDGFVVTNSNCSAAGVAMFLGELKKIVDVEKVVVTTYQALSGAGLGGVSGLKIQGNVLPFIKNEEEKIEIETRKILGRINQNEVELSKMSIFANAARVNVVDGHLQAVSVFLRDPPDLDKVQNHLQSVESSLDLRHHHVAPQKHIILVNAEDRPQPVKDVLNGSPPSAQGMSLTVGRLRVSEHCLNAYILVHNTIRGGSGGSVLNAEFLRSLGEI